MLGVFVLSGSNEVLYAFGTDDLCSHLLKRSSLALVPDRMRSSTSSGVYSDASGTECTSNSRTQSQHCSTSVISLETSKYSLADSLLPLICVYRASADVLCDPQQSIECAQIRIKFTPLANSSLVVIVSDTGFLTRGAQDKLSEVIKRSIVFFHGPLLGCASSSAVRPQHLAARRFEQRIVDILNGFGNLNTSGIGSISRDKPDEIDIWARLPINRAVDMTLSYLKLCSHELCTTMGTISCLLFADRRFVGYAQSETDGGRRHHDLRSLTQIANLVDLTEGNGTITLSSIQCSDVNISQVWTRMEDGVKMLTNVLEVPVSSRFTVLFVLRADYSSILDRLSLLLTKLRVKYLLYDNDDNVVILDAQIYLICEAFRQISQDCRAGADTSDTTFLRNGITTTKFVESLWRGIKNELLEAKNEYRRSANVATGQSSMEPVQRKLRRQLWSFATENSRNESSTNTHKSCTISERRSSKLNSMLRYFKHHLKGIMLEICLKSFRIASSFHLPRLLGVVKRFTSWHSLQNAAMPLPEAIGCQLESMDGTSFDAVKRLDMVAFTCVTTRGNIRFTHIPEKYAVTRNVFHEESCLGNGLNIKLSSVFIKGTCYLLVIIKTSGHEKEDRRDTTTLGSIRCSLLSKLKKKCLRAPKEVGAVLQCSALFEGFINQQLAMRQTNLLASALNHILHAFSRHFVS